jgi:hypothetical protein
MKRYFNYTTNNPMMIPIVESRGIPNILKNLLPDIFNKVINNINTKNIISFDFDYDNFKIQSLFVDIINKPINTIYATSQFGIFDGQYLKSPIIKIYLDIDNFDEINLKRVILHELLHIYEIFQRIKNKSKKSLQWDLNQILLKIRDKYSDDKFLNDFIYLIYLSLDQEINARIAETYSILMESNTDDYNTLISLIKNTESWKYKNYLNDFDANKYNIDQDKLKNFFDELIKEFSKKSINFKLYNKNNLNYWTSLFKQKSKKYEQKLFKLIDEVINDVKMIQSAYVDIDDTKILSEKFITKFDSDLYKISLKFKDSRK